VSGDWRSWATTAAVLLLVVGLALWFTVRNPVLLIVGALALVTSLFERSYGAPSRRPASGSLRPTDERFVDPETGHLVTVWYDPVTGERQYIGDGEIPQHRSS
jgi:hypothetical protein